MGKEQDSFTSQKGVVNIVMFGPPNAGKGTQAANLMKRFKVGYISTGDLLRAEVDKNSDIGKIIKPIMDKGDLIPNKYIVDLIKAELTKDENKHGLLLDGFPTNKETSYFA